MIEHAEPKDIRRLAEENLKRGMGVGVFRAFNFVGDQQWEFSPEVRERVTSLCGKIMQIFDESEIRARTAKDKVRDLRKQWVEDIAAGEALQDSDYMNLRSKLIPRRGWKGSKKLRAEVGALYKPEGSGGAQ
jgi:hypothetical protein